MPNDQTGDDDDKADDEADDETDIKSKLISLPGSSEVNIVIMDVLSGGVVKCSEITSKVVGGGEEGMY